MCAEWRVQDDGQQHKMYQPGILMKAYNGFMKAAKIRGVRAEDILFLCVCVLYAMTCHGNMMLSAGCSQTVERFITPDVWVPMCPAFGCMFACVRDGASQGYHPRSTGIREEEAPLVSEMNTNFQ